MLKIILFVIFALPAAFCVLVDAIDDGTMIRNNRKFMRFCGLSGAWMFIGIAVGALPPMDS